MHFWSSPGRVRACVVRGVQEAVGSGEVGNGRSVSILQDEYTVNTTKLYA